jgi:hypothetical protein
MSLRWSREANYTGEDRYEEIECSLRDEIRVRYHLDFHRFVWFDSCLINHIELVRCGEEVPTLISRG